MYDGTRFVVFAARRATGRSRGAGARRGSRRDIWAGVYGAGDLRLPVQRAGARLPRRSREARGWSGRFTYSGKRLWVGADDGLWVTDLVSSLEWVEVDPRMLSGKAVSALWEDQLRPALDRHGRARAVHPRGRAGRAPRQRTAAGAGRGHHRRRARHGSGSEPPGDGLWRFGEELDDSAVDRPDDPLRGRRAELQQGQGVHPRPGGQPLARPLRRRHRQLHGRAVRYDPSFGQPPDPRRLVGAGGPGRAVLARHRRRPGPTRRPQPREAQGGLHGLHHRGRPAPQLRPLRASRTARAASGWPPRAVGWPGSIRRPTQDRRDHQRGRPAQQRPAHAGGRDGRRDLDRHLRAAAWCATCRLPTATCPATRGRFEHYPLKAGGSHVYTILRDDSGTIWVGADSLGLAEFVPRRRPEAAGDLPRSTARPRACTTSKSTAWCRTTTA